MATRRRHHATEPALHWLRVGAVAAGLGAAITVGQGVAAATPSDAADSQSPPASSEAGSSGSDSGGGTGSQEGAGEASAQSGPSAGRPTSTVTSQQNTNSGTDADNDADKDADSEPDPEPDETTVGAPTPEIATPEIATPEMATPGSTDTTPDSGSAAAAEPAGPSSAVSGSIAAKPPRVRATDDSTVPEVRTGLPTHISPADVALDTTAQVEAVGAAASAASREVAEIASVPTGLAAIDVPPAPAVNSVTIAAAPPAAAVEVTLNSIATDVLTWIGWGPLASGLPLPVVPLPTLVQAMWLVVRQTQYILNPVGASYLTGQTVGAAPGAVTAAAASLGPEALAELLARAGVDVALNADGTISVIGGNFTDTTVLNTEAAAQLLNELAPLLGASTGFANLDNITVEHVAVPGAVPETIYRLRDTVNGIPVVGSEVILVTDESGRVTALFNNHDVRIDSLDATPDGRLDDPLEAVVAATVAYFFSAVTQPLLWPTLPFMAFADFEPRLVLSSLDPDAPPELAWQVAVDPFDPLAFLGLTAAPQPGTTYFIDANGADAGTVLEEVSDADFFGEPTTTTGYDLLGKLRTIDVGRLDLFLFAVDNFTDIARDIAIHQWVGLGYPMRLIPDIVTVRGAIPALVANVIPFVQYIPVVRDIPILGWLVGGWNPSAVSGLANMATVYDYYKNVLGRTSFDGNGAEIIVVVDYNPGGPLFSLLIPFPNAWWSPGDQMMVFGRNYVAAMDVVGHEFTHAVVTYVVGGLGGGESGALNEAYADILGNLIEGKTDEGRWFVSEDTGKVLRDMADPTSLANNLGPYPDHYDDRYTGPQDNGGVHQNSTIFSHAAYLMMTDPETSDISAETWAGVFYQSLYKLSPGAKFVNARAAILQTAKDSFGFTDAQLAAVKQAFDDVGIA